MNAWPARLVRGKHLAQKGWTATSCCFNLFSAMAVGRRLVTDMFSVLSSDQSVATALTFIAIPAQILARRARQRRPITSNRRVGTKGPGRGAAKPKARKSRSLSFEESMHRG